MLISEQRLDKALAQIAESDTEIAEWKGMVLRTEFTAKAAQALAFKALEGSVEDRKQGALLEEPVKKAWEEHFRAVVEFERLKARREREFTIIEIWRSLESSRRHGNIQ